MQVTDSPLFSSGTSNGGRADAAARLACARLSFAAVAGTPTAWMSVVELDCTVPAQQYSSWSRMGAAALRCETGRRDCKVGW